MQAGTSVLGGTTKVDEGIFLEGQRNFLPFECKDAEELKVQPTYSISDILKDPSTRSRIGRPALQTVNYCVREGAKFAVCYDGQCCILFKRYRPSALQISAPYLACSTAWAGRPDGCSCMRACVTTGRATVPAAA